ncbi:MAG: rod shape-determining protein [Planctomycetota bacterium]|nr:rod shape-determining protein [Planctomycetota bacterium]
MLNRIFGHFGSDVAVDLGTVNTLVGVVGRGLVLDEPSVVAVEKSSGRILSGGCAVGFLARQMLGRTPDTISVVRPLRSGVITDFQQCEAMLRYFLHKAKSGRLGYRPRVLVAVPGCITAVEKRAVFNSTHRAGAREVLLIDESKAAAIGVGLPVAEPVANMVCDIGGGTTEVAVFSLNDMVSGRSIRTGGDDMDQALADYLLRDYSLRIGLPAAERLRIEAGSAAPLEEEIVREISGMDAVSGLPRKAIITSEEIRHALDEPLERIVDAIKATLDGCSPELATDLVDNGMVLCGGAALLRGLERFISEQTGLPVRVAAEGRNAVAKGALVCLEHLDRWRPALQSSDTDV